MKKITELDGARVYSLTGELPWLPRCRKYKLKENCIELSFTPAQQQFLKKHNYTARPHPKHSPTVEIFVDEQTLTEQDWTVLYLLFTTRRNHRD